jgi:hypothetical protein
LTNKKPGPRPGPWIFRGLLKIAFSGTPHAGHGRSAGKGPAGRGLVLLLAGLACWALLLPGCGGRRPHVQEFSALPAGAEARTIAVLPFANRSGYDQGGKIAQRLLVGELVRHCDWRLALEGDILKIYRQMRLRPWEIPSIEQLRVMAARLGADLLVAGEVLEMEEKAADGGASPLFAVQLRVYDGSSGLLLWSTLHRRQGSDYQQVMHFGMVNTVSAVGRKTTEEIVREWQKRGVLACPE